MSYRYTASQLKQIGAQRDAAYAGIETVRTITMGIWKGKPLKGIEITKTMDPFSIAETVADYDIALKWARYALGSTKGYCYGVMRDWLNGKALSTMLLMSRQHNTQNPCS